MPPSDYRCSVRVLERKTECEGGWGGGGGLEMMSVGSHRCGLITARYVSAAGVRPPPKATTPALQYARALMS